LSTFPLNYLVTDLQVPLVDSDGLEDLRPQFGENRSALFLVFGLDTKRLSSATIMSINWAQLNERKQPIPINNEVIVKSEPNAELVLSCNPPETNQAPSAKGKAKANALKATGTVYVTDQRVRWLDPLISPHHYSPCPP